MISMWYARSEYNEWMHCPLSPSSGTRIARGEPAAVVLQELAG